MLSLDNTKEAVQTFADNVVQDAKANLIAKKKVSSGELLDSIKSTGVKLTPRSLEIGITLANYGGFIDKGVSGTETKYDTPYSYTDKMPPPSAFDGWMVRRGIAPRDSKGAFLPRKSIQFAIAMSIFKEGIEPSNFLSDAVKKNINQFPLEIQKKFGLDVKASINFIIKSNIPKVK